VLQAQKLPASIVPSPLARSSCCSIRAGIPRSKRRGRFG
jgi:hypothetical protein